MERKIAHSVFESDKRFPLYYWYAQQCAPHRAYVTLDLRDGEVDCEVESCGGSCSADVFSGDVVRFPINNRLTTKEVHEEIEKIIPQFQAILDSDSFDDEKTEETRDLILTLQMETNDQPIGFDVGYGPVCERTFVETILECKEYPDDDQTVDEFFRSILELDGEDGTYFDDGFDLDTIKELTTEYWLNCLYSDHLSIPKKVAVYLKSLGKDVYGAWGDELNEIIAA